VPIDFAKIQKTFRVPPGTKFRLADCDPGWAGDGDIPERERKDMAEGILAADVGDLARMQELLWASDTWSVLVIFQAMDAAGKDGAIKNVMSGVNPQGVEVTSFKKPSDEELDHTFLWRCMKRVPERGRIGIFNRSYYEEVLVVRVHDALLAAQRIPGVTNRPRTWNDRFDDINASDKHWKFSPSDVAERQHWDDYMAAYEEAISATSTDHAPWYVVPADKKWVSRAVVAAVLAGTIRNLGLEWPKIDDTKRRQIDEARRLLEAE
jgi:polyphosphate kinase 2 (PPK2 family)